MIDLLSGIGILFEGTKSEAMGNISAEEAAAELKKALDGIEPPDRNLETPERDLLQLVLEKFVTSNRWETIPMLVNF